MKKRNFRWQLALYDLLVLLAVDLLLLVFYRSNEELSLGACLMHGSISFVSVSYTHLPECPPGRRRSPHHGAPWQESARPFR